MTQGRAGDAQLIVFLVELLSFIARWLNPDLSDDIVAMLAGDFLLQVTGRRDNADPMPGEDLT